jgi:predicted lipid-binding transport protein (Tim44 family)
MSTVIIAQAIIVCQFFGPEYVCRIKEMREVSAEPLTDDTTGDVVAGSKLDPVKFEEWWAFTRTIESTSGELTAISQA